MSTRREFKCGYMLFTGMRGHFSPAPLSLVKAAGTGTADSMPAKVTRVARDQVSDSA